MKKPNPEQARYEYVYKSANEGIPEFQTYNYEKYKEVNPGRHLWNELLSCESVLDVGCGNNRLCKMLRLLGKDVCGVDFASPAADMKADVLDLPFRDKKWDMVVALDVLEHLLPSQVVPALIEMKRVSKRFIFKISHRPSAMNVLGANLHQTVEPREWWLERIRIQGGLPNSGKSEYIRGRWI